MKHNVGDVVRIKSKEWYEENTSEGGMLFIKGWLVFTPYTSKYCGKTATILYADKRGKRNSYKLDIDSEHGGLVDGDGDWWDDYAFEEDDIEEETIVQQINNSTSKPIDWGKRRYDLAKCAMKSLLTTTEIIKYENSHFELNVLEKAISDISINIADELIKQLKESEVVK